MIICRFFPSLFTMPSASPKGSIKSRSLDLSSIQVGKELPLDRLPLKADIICLARFFQREKNINPRHYSIKQVAKDVSPEVLSVYKFICPQFTPPIVWSKDKVEESVHSLLKRAQIVTPNLKGKASKIEALLNESVELFDIFSCNRYLKFQF